MLTPKGSQFRVIIEQHNFERLCIINDLFLTFP